MTPMNDATIAQVRAANPTASTWVSANAGSGKTRVLTDRVARLLLRGTAPQKILCLTYTKAAASHMQNQLFDRLGKWAMLDDATLLKALADLGETDTTPQNLRTARTLFARALETPGGLKIQTIHSFCANLLRRFPLEAGVSPQFQEMDDRSAKRLRTDILEDLAEGDTQAAFDAMALHLSGDDTEGLLKEIAQNRTQFTRVVSEDEIWTALGLPAGHTLPEILAEAIPHWAEDVIPDLIAALLTGKSTDLKAAAKLTDLTFDPPKLSTLLVLESLFLFGSSKKNKTPDAAKLNNFPTKDLRESIPDLMEAVQNLMLRVQTARQHRRALQAAQKTAALHQFARAFLPRYAQRKQQNGWLDFDDLILKARDLLTDSATAQWILFRLDGGIDHILVDEAQDTSPAQWDVITKLAEEFTTGAGARDVARTIFVVGDEKQSIYSFQGADPVAFGQMRDHFATHLEQIQSRLERNNLLFSFRSAEPVLRLVDSVLDQNPPPDTADTTQHRAFYDTLPGRVDIWPFLPKTSETTDANWFDPIDMPAPSDPARILAGQVADQIGQLIDDKTQLHTSDGPRQIRASDFLILVQRRSDLFHEIIKALKDRDISVAGADRLKIGGELAVKDLIACLSFMSLPEDDLSLACALRSPLLGLSEQQLYTLAQPRKASLWQSLRTNKEAFAQTHDILNDLLKNVDFLRPFELLERILTTHGGRQNLIARLGAEAEDGIDALLAEALRYEQVEPPSLTGFLGWMESGDVEIKRQMDAASNQVRVMTVHGAKGLESPVVILPDTAKRTPQNKDALATLDNGLPIWKPNADDCPPEITAARDLQSEKRAQENQRLLYVALTRAENWLIVCGAGDPGKDLSSWYNQVSHAMDDVGAFPHDFAAGAGQRYQSADWQDETTPDAAPLGVPHNSLPNWATTLAPKAAATAKPLSPSDLGGAKIVLTDGGGLDEAAAKKRGRQIHLLLEHLPAHLSADWPTLATKLLGDGMTPADCSALLGEVTPILQDPTLAHLFAPNTLSEVPITAPLAELDGETIYGFIDRLVITKTSVLAVDFKSNTDVPTDATDVPLGILRQMSAYRAALAAIYPDHIIDTAILWTRTKTLMFLPHNIVTQSFKIPSTS